MDQSDMEANAAGRRRLMRGVVSLIGVAMGGCAGAKAAGAGQLEANGDESSEAEVTPGEDLMQEHGVIERALLIYEEAGRRMDRGEQFDLEVVTSTAAIVRHFVEDYHERSEEQFVFPRL
ncbi:MAG TPA: hypothetical protein VHZ95_19450, partial [Polyangiales bacterium]|nr:hypothetical protein [Polyangiales bacterium]